MFQDVATMKTALAILAVLAQAPTFSSRVDAVRVDVLVTDNGKPVLGLDPGRLRDPG